MFRKVCIFVDWNMYEVVRHFTKKLGEAMERQGIAVQIIDANEGEIDPMVFHDFLLDPPDLTCSFNRIAKTSGGKFLWDVLKIPHVAFLVDPPIYYLDLIGSPYLILTSVDRSDAQHVRSLMPRVLFWPHAIERDLHPDPNQKRDLDVVFFGSCFDFMGLRKEWQSKLSPELCRVLDEAIEIALLNGTMTLADALSNAWKYSGLDQDVGQQNFLLLYHYMEKYLLGKDRLELLKSIKDATVHIYGQPFPLWNKKMPGWFDYLKDQKNMRFHRPVPYTQTFEILKRSKLCLNSVPSFRDGTHERIFAGLACGALPLTTESLYLSENFTQGKEILYYKINHWNEANELVNEYLADEEKRASVAASGRQKVIRDHTWDARVAQLIKELPPLLSGMPKTKKAH